MTISRENIIKAIQKGTLTANKKYEKWSHGWWLDDAGVESVMVVGIAEALNEVQQNHESLRLEEAFQEIKYDSKASLKPGPIPKVIADRKRADIVLFDQKKHPKPTCVIEVKRSWDATNCIKDMERIRELVDRFGPSNKGSLKRGFLALMITGEEKNKHIEEYIEARISDIKDIIENDFKNHGKKIRYHRSKVRRGKEEYGYNNWGAASFCIEIHG